MNRMLRLGCASVFVGIIGGLTGCGSDTSAGIFIPATPMAEEVRRVVEPPTPTPLSDLGH